jgi:excisionase family DNA binding protein
MNPKPSEPAPGDLMTTKELAEYLRLNERTVLKLASQGELPAARLGNQWRFRRAVVDAWLDDQMLGVRPTSPSTPSGEPATFSFDDGFRPEHVVEALRGTTVPAALEELATRARELGLIVDKTWFLGALLERENVLSSAVGEGVAFPHTLDRHPEQVREPFLLVGRSERGIDFAALDGEPVHIVVLMGLRYQKLHLPWLKRLSGLLRDPRVRDAIAAAPDAEAICEVLRGGLAIPAATRR